MHITLKMIFQIIVGALGYIVWAVMAYYDPIQRPDFLKFNIAMAVGTISLVIRDMSAPGAAPPASIQQTEDKQ